MPGHVDVPFAAGDIERYGEAFASIYAKWSGAYREVADQALGDLEAAPDQPFSALDLEERRAFLVEFREGGRGDDDALGGTIAQVGALTALPRGDEAADPEVEEGQEPTFDGDFSLDLSGYADDDDDDDGDDDDDDDGDDDDDD